MAVNGEISDGFATTVLPDIKAGAIFQVNKYKGRFHGEIQPTTPRGERVIKFDEFSSWIFDSKWNDFACSAKNLKFDIARGISIFFDNLIGLPVSLVSKYANSSNHEKLLALQISSYINDGYKTLGDLVKRIEYILKINNLTLESYIYPGQKLKIPKSFSTIKHDIPLWPIPISVIAKTITKSE